MDPQERVIPFHYPHATSKESQYVSEVIRSGLVSGDGKFSKLAQGILKTRTGSHGVLLTHSCTAALEMSALLCELEPGDEVIMPSYTFVSTANAFVLVGAVPVFVDVRADTLNIDESKIEEAITPKTKAICVVHYGGVGCEMDKILEIARRHDLWVIEDAAQGVQATYKGKALGAIGDFGTYSFHQSKNITSGEGGAILIQDPTLFKRAEIIREKGTDRSLFLRGEVDKYCWRDVGSSYLPSDLIAAYLVAQLEEAEKITAARMAVWETYRNHLAIYIQNGVAQTQVIPNECQHNAHLFCLVFRTETQANGFLSYLRENRIQGVRHYVPLHSSPAGLIHGRAHGELPVTDHIGKCLVRLPLWTGLIDRSHEVAETVARYLKNI